jgi:hypothetical protein
LPLGYVNLSDFVKDSIFKNTSSNLGKISLRGRGKKERVVGLEPTPSDSKNRILLLGYIFVFDFVRGFGFLILFDLPEPNHSHVSQPSHAEKGPEWGSRGHVGRLVTRKTRVVTGRGKWSALGSNLRPRTPRVRLLPLQHFSICDTLTIVCFIYEPMDLRDHVATLGWSSCFTGTTWLTVTPFLPSFFLFNLYFKFETSVSRS